MQNKFIRKNAIFTIFSLLILIIFAPMNVSYKSNLQDSPINNNEYITYDIYFDTTSPPKKVVSNQTETTYNPGLLEYNTTYYWQIIAWNDLGESSEGKIWSFTTEVIAPSVETLYADKIEKNNATIHGKILEDGGEQCQIRFRYKKSGETNWTYSSDWNGSYYKNDTFSQEINGLYYNTTYEFRAGARNSKGENWGETKNFTSNINQLPVPIIDAPYTGYKNVDITFDGTNSYDPDGHIIEYLWYFSDNSSDNGSMVDHQFQYSETYTVTLQVEDDDNCTSQTDHNITISNRAPIASFEVDDDDCIIEIGTTLTFDGTGSSDPDGDELTYEWKIDDTVIGTEPIVSYTFNEPGDHQMTLTVTDDDTNNPLSDIVSVTIHVNVPPIADFIYEPQDPFIGDIVTFNGSLSYDSDGYIVDYAWDFGDGDTNNGMEVQHVFIYDGIFTVTLTVTDDTGATGDHSEDINVQGPYIISNKHISSQHGNSNFISRDIIKTINSNNPPNTPTNPYPEDKAINVPIDVVLSWISGENNAPNTPVISGKTNGKVGKEYQYCINSVIDPDGDNVWVLWDWGDDTESGWLGPYDSGQKACANHSWNEKGIYIIKAKLKDEYDILSDWGYLQVNMPKFKILDNIFLYRILERIAKFFFYFTI